MLMNTPSRRTLRRVAAIAALTVAGGLTLGAVASPHGGMHHPMGGAEMLPMGGRGLERMLDGVNATAEQRTQIEQITQAARKDMLAERDARRALREQALTLFAQPTVDAAAAEALRQQMLAQHDRNSQRMTQAMLEVSRVLTPEQRQQIAERVKQRGEHMRERFEKRAAERRGE
jgi:Spy/CpxP family protein refolding chaperone